jgi:Uma2 family endonuclease
MPLSHHRFTVDEYHRMAEAGILTEDDRVELLDGQIVPMTPIGPGHAGCVDALARLFMLGLGSSVIVRVQNPVVLGSYHEPEPDIAIVRSHSHGYRTRHPVPEDILLLIEVADSSVGYDRSLKLRLYAESSIPETWLINLPKERIEVYREPQNGVYPAPHIVGRNATLIPVQLPALQIPSDEILGPDHR